MRPILLRICTLAALLLSLPAPAVALSAAVQADGCQTGIAQGLWQGQTHMFLNAKHYQDGSLAAEFNTEDEGTLSLQVGCQGVTGGTWHIDHFYFVRLNNGYYECRDTYDLTQLTGPVVTRSGGQPGMDVRFGSSQVAGTCEHDPTYTPATVQFTVSSQQEHTMQGDWYTKSDDPHRIDEGDMAQYFRSQGYMVVFERSFTLTRQPQPTVQGLSAQLRQYFLRGIPVTNRYTASIDWDGTPPGTARFLLGNDPPRNMAVSGNSAIYDLALGSINRTGDIPISVEAESEGRTDRLDSLGPLTLVPVPNWAQLFSLQARTQDNSVLYKGQYLLPDQPLKANVELPTVLPYVGGTWGLLPTQLRVGLTANSLGTRERDGVSAQGGFGLGKRTWRLSATGNVYSTITHDNLLFESDQATLSTSGILYQDHLGLLSVIPGASALFSVPVIGDLLQTLNAALGVSADVHGAMTGRGRLGLRGSTLALTEGTFDASLGVRSAAGINTPVAWAQVQGGGEGSLSMNIVPSAGVTKCQVLLYFSAGAGAFGYVAGPVQSSYPIYTCTTASGQTILVSTRPEASQATLTYGWRERVAGERSVLELQSTNGLSETVLADNTSTDARPLLVAGPNGRLAMVWNSVSSSTAADAISLRLYDGTAWGNIVTVSQSGKPAFTPSAAFTANGNLLVVWAEAQTAPNPSGLSEAFARSMEIAWAELSVGGGQVVQRGQLTSDNVMDFSPRLSATANGTVWLAWQKSPATKLTGTVAAPNQLLAARWTGSAWSTVETAATNLVGTLFWELAAADTDRVWIVADGDTDGNLSTANDREIYVYKRTVAGWATPQRLTNDTVADTGPLLTLTPAGQPVLAWSHGGAVMGVRGDPASTPTQVWFDTRGGIGTMLSNGELLASADGSLVLIWAEGTAQGQDAWLSRYNPANRNWSPPAPLFRSAEQRRSLSAQLQANSDILLGLAAAPVTERTVTFDGGGTATVPSVGSSARLLVARIPKGYIPPPQHPQLFFPTVQH